MFKEGLKVKIIRARLIDSVLGLKVGDIGIVKAVLMDCCIVDFPGFDDTIMYYDQLEVEE